MADHAVHGVRAGGPVGPPQSGVSIPKAAASPPSLWPQALSAPWVFWAAVAIPCLLLAAGNAWDLDLLFAEMNAFQRAIGLSAVSLPVIAAAWASVWTWRARARGRSFSLVTAAVVWTLGALYLTIAFSLADSVVPDSVPMWMFSSQDFVFRQFSLAMIPTLFALCRLALVGSVVGTGSVVLTIAAAVVGAGFAVGGMFAGGLLGTLLPWASVSLLSATLAAGSSLLVATMIRVSVVGYGLLRRRSAWATSAMLIVLGLVLPLTGLWLNSVIQFPANFQSPWVWEMAVVNGIMLALPGYRNPVAHRVVWLARCACLPFTVYFFLVFLPVVPLAPLAMLALGAGFLMLVPTMLFAVHVWRIYDGWREVRDVERGLPLGMLGIAAAFALPLGLAFTAQRDKLVLDQALAYFSTPDFSLNSRFPSDPGPAIGMLRKINDLRLGARLPLIDDYYRRVVFGGLVLPQQTVADLHQRLTGNALPTTMSAFPMRAGVAWRGGMQATLPPNPAMLATATTTTRLVGPHVAETTMRINFANPLAETAEFFSAMTLAPGTYVIGYRLQIDGSWVDGQLFDEKAATWLYEKIRLQVAPRDPGLLRVDAEGRLSLRVFPVAAHEKRSTEITILHPAAIAVPIQLANEKIGVQSVGDPITTEKGKPFVAECALGSAIFLPAGAIPPSRARRPVELHIFEHSAANPVSDQDIASMQTGAADCLAYVANFEVSRFDPESPSRPIPARGGWDPDRAIRTVLGDFAACRDLSVEYPVVVLHGDSDDDTPAVGPVTLSMLSRLSPESPTVQLAHSPPPASADVRVLRWNGRVLVTPKDDAFVLIPDDGTVEKSGLEALDAAGRWRPVAFDALQPGLPFNAVVEAALLAEERIVHPHRFQGALGPWLERVKATGVLVPGVAFIAAETNSQWKTLERAEAKRAKKDDAFEIEEMPEVVPEPSIVTLLVLLSLAIATWRMQFLRRVRGVFAVRRE